MSMKKAEGRRQKAVEKRRRLFIFFTFAFCILHFSSPVWAHEGKPHHFGDLWFTWGRDPVVILGLALTAGLYWRGLRRGWRGSSGRGGSERRRGGLGVSGGGVGRFLPPGS